MENSLIELVNITNNLEVDYREVEKIVKMILKFGKSSKMLIVTRKSIETFEVVDNPEVLVAFLEAREIDNTIEMANCFILELKDLADYNEINEINHDLINDIKMLTVADVGIGDWILIDGIPKKIVAAKMSMCFAWFYFGDGTNKRMGKETLVDIVIPAEETLDANSVIENLKLTTIFVNDLDEVAYDDLGGDRHLLTYFHNENQQVTESHKKFNCLNDLKEFLSGLLEQAETYSHISNSCII